MAQVKKYLKGNQITYIQNLESKIDELLLDPNISDDLKAQALAIRESVQNIIGAEQFRGSQGRAYTASVNDGVIKLLSGEKAYSPSKTGSAYKNSFGYYSRPELDWMANETIRRVVEQKNLQGVEVDPNWVMKNHVYWKWNKNYDPSLLRKDMSTSDRINSFVDAIINNMTDYLNLDLSLAIVHGVSPQEAGRFAVLIDGLNQIKELSDNNIKLDKLSQIVAEIGEYLPSIKKEFKSQFARELDVTPTQTVGTAHSEMPAGLTLVIPNDSNRDFIKHLSEQGYLVGQKDGKNYAYKTVNGVPQIASTNYGFIGNDFTSPLYKKGVFILPNGEILWGDDLVALRTALGDNDSLYSDAYKNISELSNKYRHYNPQFIDNSGTIHNLASILGNGTDYVDLSNYIVGNDVILTPILENDDYNWSTPNRVFYKLSRGDNGVNVQELSWNDIKDKFRFKGKTDITENPNESQDNLLLTQLLLSELPKNWNLIPDQISLDTNTLRDVVLPTIDPIKQHENYDLLRAKCLIESLIEDLPQYYNSDIINQRKEYWLSILGLKGMEQFDKWKKNFMNLDVKQKLGVLKSIYKKYYPQLDADLRQALKLYLDSFNAQQIQASKLKEGGEIQKFWEGGNVSTETLLPQAELPQTPTLDEYNALKQKAETEGLSSLEGSIVGDRELTLKELMSDLKPQDYYRMAALAADVAGFIGSFAVGPGTAVAATSGLTSTGLDMAADIKDPSVSKGQVVGNAAANLLFGVIGLIPGGTGWKLTKRLLTWGPMLVLGGLLASDITKKLSAGEDLTYDDWKNVYYALSAAINMSTMGRQAWKMQRLKAPEASKTGKILLKDPTTGDEHSITTEALLAIDDAGRKYGLTAALKKLEQVVDPALAKKISATFDYGKVKQGDSRGAIRAKLAGIKPILGTEETSTALDVVGAFYKDNSRRKGNPWNPQAWNSNETTSWPKLWASDFQMAREKTFPLTLQNFEFEKLQALRNLARGLVKGPKWAEANLDYVNVEGTKDIIKPVAKGNKAIRIKNIDMEVKPITVTPELNPEKFTDVVKSLDGKHIYGKKDGKYVEFKLLKKSTKPAQAPSLKTGGRLDRLNNYIHNNHA